MYKRQEGDNTQLGVVIRNDNSTEPRARASVEEVYTQINEAVSYTHLDVYKRQVCNGP